MFTKFIILDNSIHFYRKNPGPHGLHFLSLAQVGVDPMGQNNANHCEINRYKMTTQQNAQVVQTKRVLELSA
jgi:hypothetical protein